MNNVSQDFFATLMRTQFMPAEELRAYQRGLLERLLRHAHSRVPFYRDTDRLAPLFRTDGTIDWERWPEVPVLTRREAQQQAAALYAEAVPPECGEVVPGYTAGSTGTPLAFRINGLMAAVGSAMMERGFAWAGLPERLSVAWFRNDRQGGAAYPHGQTYHAMIRGTVRLTHHLSIQTPIDEQGYWLARVQPDVVMSYPGALALLAHQVPTALSAHRFRLAVCVGEVTTEQDRAAIEAGFRCPVLDLYSGAEFGPVAVEDPRLRRLFACEETTLIELLPRHDDFAGPDAPAEVILTPFYNYAMPLVRYAPGDFALVDAGAPPDARTLRRLARIAGRARNFFLLPSGRRWWPTYENKVLCDFLDYRQIQFAQTGPQRIEIRFASDHAAPIKDAERLHAYLRAATPEPMDIALTRVDRIAQRASGKYEYATCELDPSAAAACIDAEPGIAAAPDIVAVPDRPRFVPSPAAPYRREETIRALHEAWRRTQYQPPHLLMQQQRSLLEALLRHARAHVPFYRDSDRLAPVFRGDDTIDWDRWTEIPPLTRREVQQAGSALHAEQLPLDHGRTWVLSTSGSTGEPVRVVHDALSGEAAWIAVYLRDLERYKIDATQRLATLRVFEREDQNIPHARRYTSWNEPLASLGIFGERLDLAAFLPPGRIIDELLAFAPRYLRVNPLRLELLCNWDVEHRLRDLRLDAVMTFTDHLSDETRRLASEHLQCRIIDRYASNECGCMASTCPLCGRFHVHAESVLVEIVGEDDLAVRPGETGWVVATPLYNYAMPLIRYHHADRARVGAPDLCPMTLPTLDSVLGKDTVIFTFRGGVTVRPFVPPGAVIRNLGAQAFQVAQVAEDRCEFRIVPGRIPPSEMRFDAITQLLLTRWWKDLKIDYRIVDDLPTRNRYRKPATFVRELSG